MGFAGNGGLVLMAVIVPLLAAAALLLRSARFARVFQLSSADLIFRALIAAALCLALAQPYSERVSDSSQALALLDISDSMDEGLAQKLLDRALQLKSQDTAISVIPFAGESAALRIDAASAGSFSKIKDAWGRLNIGQTSLEQALRQAGAQAAASAVLISDGWETAGNAQEALPALVAGGLRVFPVLPESGLEQPQLFRISNLYAPLVAPAQKSVDVHVSVLNTTGRSQSGTLELKHDDKVILQTRVDLEPGRETLFTAQSDPSSEGIKQITAALTPAEKSLAPSAQTVFLSSESREKVLVISGSEEDGRLLLGVLQNQSYQVTGLNARGGLTTLPDLSGFSTIMLNNTSLAQLPPGSAAAIEKFVSGGGGFIMLGGNRSFGLGGYIGSPIEEVLPVQMIPPHAEQKRLNVAVMLIIDKSRSMADDQKLEYSKEAAKEVVRLLKDDDFVGVIGFDESPFEVVRMGRVGEIRGHAMERIGRLYPDKRTNLFPSMEEGRRRLEAVEAGRKHMVILTDGKIPDASISYTEMVKQMRFTGITVSTVMIGSEFDFGFLRSLADYGGGAHYQTDNPSDLPRIFLQDVKVQSGERTMKEQSEFPVRPGTSELKSTSLDSFPPLRGFVENKSRNRASLELTVMNEGKAYPLLATWKYGRGKAAAFTSDANGRWSSWWAAWPKFATFWSEIIDAVRPEAGSARNNIRFDLRTYLEHGSLMLDLAVYSELNTGTIEARLIQPDRSTRDISFKSVSQGRFLASVERPSAGRYELRAQAGQTSLTPVAFYVSGELFGEKKGLGFNTALLEKLAAATSGRVNPQAADLAAQTTRKVARTDLSPYFLLLAALLLCLDVLRREVWWRYSKAFALKR